MVVMGQWVSRAEFLLVGLAFGEIIRQLAYELVSVTGGSSGLSLEGMSWALPALPLW